MLAYYMEREKQVCHKIAKAPNDASQPNHVHFGSAYGYIMKIKAYKDKESPNLAEHWFPELFYTWLSWTLFPQGLATQLLPVVVHIRQLLQRRAAGKLVIQGYSHKGRADSSAAFGNEQKSSLEWKPIRVGEK